MYSQHDEEKIILANTPALGRCLDIGAYAALTFSNTRALIERGWEAVLVEPSAGPFAGLMEAYKNDEKVTLINAFAGSQWRMRGVYMTPDALTTGDEANYQKWKAVGQFRQVLMPEVPLQEILKVAGNFNFLSVDTEGSSLDLLTHIDLDKHKTDLVCVEHDGNKEGARLWFELKGFAVISENGGNTIAKRKA